MLVAFSQPHFTHFDWKAADADQDQRLRPMRSSTSARPEPSVGRGLRMSHNATGYDEDMNPDLIDGLQDLRDDRGRRTTPNSPSGRKPS